MGKKFFFCRHKSLINELIWNLDSRFIKKYADLSFINYVIHKTHTY